MNFEKKYWDENYSDPKSMDGIGNAKIHTQYLKHLLRLEYIDISSIIDYGFGYGYLFKEMIHCFKPHTAIGIEPSHYAFQKVFKKKERFTHISSINFDLYEMDLKHWFFDKENEKQNEVFDLGICTSVFQYIKDEDLKTIIPLMAKQVKYLYLTVPTNIELKRQVDELDFEDRFALRRSRRFYHRILRKNFTFISSRLLESKFHFNEQTTFFSDLIYRY